MNASSVIANAKKKVEKLLDDVNKMVPKLRSVGLYVAGIDVEMGLLPAVSVKVMGSVRNVDPEKLRHLRESNKDNRILTGILRSIESAVNMKEVLASLAADTVEVDAKLGIFPKINVRFLPSAIPVATMGAGPAVPQDPVPHGAQVAGH